MSGTIVVDRIESDASYASSINIASPIQISNTITGNVNFDSGTLFVNATDNRVGIGTSSPAQKLHVYFGASGGTRTAGVNTLITESNIAVGAQYLSPNNTIQYLFFGDPENSQSGRILYDHNVDAFAFNTAASERMRIDSSGKVLVNRATQQSGSYTVTGGVYCEGLVSNYGIGSHSGIGGAYQVHAINFQWNGSATRLWVDATDTGSITVSSDYRIKRNIATQEQPALDRIAQIRPVIYQKADYGNLFVADDVLREGFIAHELAEVIPSAVEGEKDAENQIQSLKLDALCSVMVKAIQELSAKVDSLQAEINQLKG